MGGVAETVKAVFQMVSQRGGLEEIAIQNGCSIDPAEMEALDLSRHPVVCDFGVCSPSNDSGEMFLNHVQNFQAVDGLEFPIPRRAYFQPAIVNAFGESWNQTNSDLREPVEY